MKKYFNIIALVLITASLSSCLKNKYNALDPDKSPSVIEFKNPTVISPQTPPGVALYSMYEFSADKDEAVKTYTIQLSGQDPASQDINVTIAVDPTAVDKFNASRDKSLTKFLSLPANLYKLSATNLVIPKGQRSVNFTVTYNIPDFDFDADYALPLVIKSTSFATISGNFGTILINMQPKNDYDGVYKVTNLVFNNVTSAVHTANTPRTRYLITAGKYESELYDPGLTNVYYGISFLNNGGASYYGNFSPVFETNAAGAVVAVTNAYGPLSGASKRDAKIDPTGVNKFTITGNSKVMEVSYIMTQDGVNTLYLKEKWEFIEKRAD